MSEKSPRGSRRKYFRPVEAREKNWFCKTELAQKYRLKPSPEQEPAGFVWQGQGTYAVYDLAKAVSMRPYRKPTTAQLEALARGRTLLGTQACAAEGCSNRIYTDFADGQYCHGCDEKQRRSKCHKAIQKFIDHEWVIVDVETTGLGNKDQVIEICIIDRQGTQLFHSLVKPAIEIGEEAAAIHGLTMAELKGAPEWPVIHDTVYTILANRPVLAYNASFDRRLIEQTAKSFYLAVPAMETHCIMEIFAQWAGDLMWDGSYRWVSLMVAAEVMGIPLTGMHRAYDDSLTTLGVLQAMCEQLGSKMSN